MRQFLIILSLTTICFALTKLYHKWQLVIERGDHTGTFEEVESKLPSFEFYDSKGQRITANDLKGSYSYVLVYFNSTCSSCDDKARQITHYISEFKKSEIIFVSSESQEDINQFSFRHELNRYENIRILRAPEETFYQYFGSSFTPGIFIYDSNHNEIIKIEDIISIKTLIGFVRKANQQTYY